MGDNFDAIAKAKAFADQISAQKAAREAATSSTTANWRSFTAGQSNKKRGSAEDSSAPPRKRTNWDTPPPAAPAAGNEWDAKAAAARALAASVASRLVSGGGGGAAAGGFGTTTKHVMVSNHHVGSIIGRGGSVIKAIMAESGARIQMQQKEEVMPGSNERGVDITGTESQVARAHQMIVGKINEAAGAAGMLSAPGGGGGGGGQQTTVMMVPSHQIGSVIGRGGSVIKELIAKSGCRIQIEQKETMMPGATQRSVTITGTGSQVQHAQQMISQQLAQETARTAGGRPPMGGGGAGDTTKIIQVPIAAIGGIIGRGGSLIKQLIQESGARIQIQQKHEVPPNAPSRAVTVTGNPANVARAEGMINARIAEATGGAAGVSGPAGASLCKCLILNEFVGPFIGRGGSEIRALGTATNAIIKISQPDSMPPGSPERIVSCSGDLQAAQGALDLIIHKFHERTPGQAASLRMLVPEQVQAGLALALGGIVQVTGVQVVLDPTPFANTLERAVTMTGAAESIKTAHRQVYSKVHELMGKPPPPSTTPMMPPPPTHAAPHHGGYAPPPSYHAPQPPAYGAPPPYFPPPPQFGGYGGYAPPPQQYQQPPPQQQYYTPAPAPAAGGGYDPAAAAQPPAPQQHYGYQQPPPQQQYAPDTAGQPQQISQYPPAGGGYQQYQQ